MKEVLFRIYFLVLMSLSGLISANTAETMDLKDKSTETSESISYIGKVSFPADKKSQLLGASSIRYDETNKRFIVLSDDTGAYPNVFGDTGQPRFYSIALSDLWSEEQQGLLENLPEQPPKLLIYNVIPNDSLKPVFGGGVDIESLATFGDNELLIASENGVWEWNAYPSLLRIDKSGRLKGFYHFPDQYMNDQSFLRTISHYPTFDKDIFGKGIKRNKGIESLDRIKGTNEYIAIVEAPLIQDEREWNKAKGMVPLRLLHFSMDEFLPKGRDTGTVSLLEEYFYPLNLLPSDVTRNAWEGYPKRSISDVEVINEKYAIVLEKSYIKYRYFDSRKPKSVTELYLVELGSSYNFVGADEDYPMVIKRKKYRTLRKKLLMRSTDMEDQVPEFARLNIEGVTLGPEFADGSRLLLLVNDNDAYNAKVRGSLPSPLNKVREFLFSKNLIVPSYFWAEGGAFSSPLFTEKEPTHLLFFKVPAMLLKKK